MQNEILNAIKELKIAEEEVSEYAGDAQDRIDNARRTGNEDSIIKDYEDIMFLINKIIPLLGELEDKAADFDMAMGN